MGFRSVTEQVGKIMLVQRGASLPKTQWKEYTFLTGEMVVAYPSDWEIESERSTMVVLQNDSQDSIFITDISDDKVVIGPKALRASKIMFADHSTNYLIRFLHEGSLEIPRKNMYFIATQKDFEQDFMMSKLIIYVGDNKHTAMIILTIHGSADVPSTMVDVAKQIATSIQFVDIE